MYVSQQNKLSCLEINQSSCSQLELQTETQAWTSIAAVLKTGVAYQKDYVVEEVMKIVQSSDDFRQKNPDLNYYDGVRNFVKGYYEEVNKGREVELYECRRPLKALNFLDDKGTKTFSDNVSWNKLYHAYLCVKTDSKNQQTPYCNGQTTEEGFSGPGKPSNDKYVAKQCEKLDEKSANPCVADCWDAILRSPERPYYDLKGDDVNCQEFVSEYVIAVCNKACE